MEVFDGFQINLSNLFKIKICYLNNIEVTRMFIKIGVGITQKKIVEILGVDFWASSELFSNYMLPLKILM